MTDRVIFRALTEGDAHLFDSLSDSGLVGRAIMGPARGYRTVGAGGEYRPDWTWVALRDGVVVARAAWWGAPADTKPMALDWFDFADGEAAVASALLRTAPLRAEYELLLPPGWRDQPAVRAAAEARIEAACAAGLRPLVERYRYEWRPEHGLPARPGRLEFRPVPDEDTLVDVLRRVAYGTLDAHDRHAMEQAGGADGPEALAAAADDLLGFLNWLPSPRDWWRLAYTADGALAGIQIPARNPSGPCVGYIGVVPEQRGHGYSYDLLVECTHDLVAQGAEVIAAATDVGNLPMAAAFERAGYPVTQQRINLI